MSSFTGLFLLVTLVVALSPAQGTWWDDIFEWTTEEPANCPHENTNTHVCSTLQTVNATCVTFKCCHDFDDTDEYADYVEGSQSEEDDENVYYFGRLFDTCSMCFSIKPCSVYKCYRRCCDGYESDIYGRCRNNTGNIQCQNGGTQMRNYWTNTYYCKCPVGFEGTSCEIPKCHCENGGECVVKDGRPHCNCSYGHYGDDCEMSDCTLRCQNGGKCYRNGTYEMCKCPHNYIGKYCETPFRQPDTCPAPVPWLTECGEQCRRSEDCRDGTICCREGCSTICRKPTVDYCEYEGRHLRIGQTFQPEACQNCTCTSTGRVICSSVSCRAPSCPDGSMPVNIPGKCCPVCQDNPVTEGPIILGCPDKVYVNNSVGRDSALLSQEIIPIRAYERGSHERLNVEFSPNFVRHCYCSENQRPFTTVRAYATDKYGNTASCSFKVAVIDNEAPSFWSCPEDIYVFEDEAVQWKKPDYYDNVKVVRMTCTDKKNGQKFPVGQHTLTYQIWDYDGNNAFCRFRVSVSRRDEEKLPQGLIDRSKDKHAGRLMIILGPIIGALILIGVALLLFLCCRRQQAGRANRNSAHGRRPPAYDNNIYATPGDPSVKLPPYSDLPMNPPVYTVTGSEKDVTYMSLPPPSYTNPGYETLKVHLQGSDTLKSEKAETMKTDSEG